jgi:hypothetical protein
MVVRRSLGGKHGTSGRTLFERFSDKTLSKKTDESAQCDVAVDGGHSVASQWDSRTLPLSKSSARGASLGHTGRELN